MALIERFTSGGNIYPDGSSRFEMLVQFFLRFAQNRDGIDQTLRNAITNGDNATRSEVVHAAEVNAQAAETNAKTYTDVEVTAARSAATAYTDASFSAAGPGGATDAQVDAAVDRAVLAGRVVPDSEVATIVGAEGSATRGALGEVFAQKAEVNAQDFGLKGDGTDETTQFQAFVNYLTANRKMGVLPAREYRISAPINIAGTEGNLDGWGIRGLGMSATTVLQTTDNTPIFRIGVGLEGPGVPGCRMWSITDLTFRYLNNQPDTNTNAHCIEFVAMCYQFELRRLFFYNGYYGQKTTVDQVVPWGGTWDDLYFNKHLSGGAIDWTAVRNDGPNNKFGRIFVEAQGMKGPIFIVQGHNTTWDTVEIIHADRGPKLFHIKAASRLLFGAIKLENSTYTAAQDLFTLETKAWVDVRQFRISSLFNVFQPVTGKVNALKLGVGGGDCYLKVGHLQLTAGTIANSYAIDGTRTNKVLVDTVEIADGWRLTDPASAQTAEMVKINSYNNGMISLNAGNANYTVTLGGPTSIYFETALTAPRTVTMPSDAYQLTGTLEYEIVSSGAVNGSNTLAIVAGTRTVHTITAANYRVVVAWRRNATGQSGWVVRSAGPIIS